MITKRLIFPNNGFPLNTFTFSILTNSVFYQSLLMGRLAAKQGNNEFVIAEGVEETISGPLYNWGEGTILQGDEFGDFQGGSYNPNNNPLYKLCYFIDGDLRFHNNSNGDILPVSRKVYYKVGDPASFDPPPFAVYDMDVLINMPRIKSLKELSQFSMPDGVVVDPNYLAFTQAMLDKLNGIQAGAQVNVKPSWTAAPGSANEILNKPEILDVLTRGTVSLGDIAAMNYPINFNGYTAPNTNYAVFVSFETLNASTANGSAFYYYVVHTKTTTGFQIAMREPGNIIQSLILHYLIVRNLF
jgi:hypothetical protein